MPRPAKWKNVCSLPESNTFMACSKAQGECVCMTVEEYETIRLIDLEGLTQEECAEQMQVARSTVQRIYNDARKKLARFLVQAGRLKIEGGDYRLYDHRGQTNGCGKGCGHRHGRGC